MKIQLLLVAACVCLASAGLPKKLVKKYAMKKVMESCLGEEVVDSIKAEVKAACGKCYGEAEPEMPQLRRRLSSVMSGGDGYGARGGGYGAHGGGGAGAPAGYQPVFVPVAAYQPFAYQRRWKRGAHLSPEKLEKMQAKIQAVVGNITCVMREMNMLDSENSVDYDSIKQRISALPLGSEIKSDMQEGMGQCKDFSSCMPDSMFENSPITAGFGKQMAFFKCMKTVKLESCMKQEFREEYYPMLTKSGLDWGEEESFQTIITSAWLEEGGDMM